MWNVSASIHERPRRMMLCDINVLHGEPPGGWCPILGNYVKENGASHECPCKMKLYDINVLHSEQLRSSRLISGYVTTYPSMLAMSMIICVSLNTLCEPRIWFNGMQGGKDSQNSECQTSFIRFETWMRACFIYFLLPFLFVHYYNLHIWMGQRGSMEIICEDMLCYYHKHKGSPFFGVGGMPLR